LMKYKLMNLTLVKKIELKVGVELDTKYSSLESFSEMVRLTLKLPPIPKKTVCRRS